MWCSMGSANQSTLDSHRRSVFCPQQSLSRNAGRRPPIYTCSLYTGNIKHNTQRHGMREQIRQRFATNRKTIGVHERNSRFHRASTAGDFFNETNRTSKQQANRTMVPVVLELRFHCYSPLQNIRFGAVSENGCGERAFRPAQSAFGT